MSGGGARGLDFVLDFWLRFRSFGGVDPDEAAFTELAAVVLADGVTVDVVVDGIVDAET